ncbi:hypothetical protein FRC12_019605 [Ceratobasidium sp. 428]|nr:hypothetical protein FRC12_019605 [Ceratobasidium sp. 428]
MDMLRAKLHRTLGYNLCINAGIEPEMAALIAVSLDKPMVPEGVSERYSAVRKWEAELAEEQERRADVGHELEKEWALREERVATRAQGRKRESRHGRQPACGEDSLSPGADPCPDQVHGTHPRTLYTPPSPKHQYKQSKHLMETTVSPLKRSGALSTPHRPNRMTEASPQVMKAGIRSRTMGI